MHEDGDGTLSSILAVTSMYTKYHVPCCQRKFESKILAKVKGATVKSLKRHNEQKNIKGRSRNSAKSKKEYFVALVNS